LFNTTFIKFIIQKVPLANCEGSGSNGNEVTSTQNSTVTEAEIQDYLANQSAIERVKYIFRDK